MLVSVAGLSTRVYRQSWADKGYDPNGHHYLITRVAMVSIRLIHCGVRLRPTVLVVHAVCAEKARGLGLAVLEGQG